MSAPATGRAIQARADFTALEATSLGPCLESLERAGLGAGLSAAAECELHLASRSYQDADRAERHLLRACELKPSHPAPLIGLYRFYFYRNRLGDALRVGLRCLEQAAGSNGLSANWRLVRAEQADFGAFSALPRFYLFSLKACSYLLLRLGDIEGGAAMLDKLQELDPGDKVNGSVLRDVLDRLGRDDDE